MDFLNGFNYLSRYATEEMPTEARRVMLCQDRLNPELKHALSAHEINIKKSLVDKALLVEESEKEVMAERKRKWVARKAISGSSSRPRVTQPATRYTTAPVSRPQFSAPRPSLVPNQQFNRGGQLPTTQGKIANVTYFNCGHLGHYSNKCPYPKK
ncbi:hypothetical protein E2562_013850 [Oryza meyeriana var. granulata]|uniref:CCHC-type domain-containing protein n=1 Tax=Oryza meyeriana var. granulata TaxID=110450 RepID=A0A6G1F866_9ORYZ|nr:hypothetical protein E2562_013850 [Oryza meyeriana var. granulata]